MFRTVFKAATVAALVGLAVLQADHLSAIVGKASATFRGAVRLA